MVSLTKVSPAAWSPLPTSCISSQRRILCLRVGFYLQHGVLFLHHESFLQFPAIFLIIRCNRICPRCKMNKLVSPGLLIPLFFLMIRISLMFIWSNPLPCLTFRSFVSNSGLEWRANSHQESRELNEVSIAQECSYEYFSSTPSVQFLFLTLATIHFFISLHLYLFIDLINRWAWSNLILYMQISPVFS